MFVSQEKREFLRPFLPEYCRVKAVAKQTPRLLAQFQSRLWLIWSRHWVPELRAPDPEDADVVCHWNRCCQRVSSVIAAGIHKGLTYFIGPPQNYQDSGAVGTLLCQGSQKDESKTSRAPLDLHIWRSYLVRDKVIECQSLQSILMELVSPCSRVVLCYLPVV